MPKKKSTRKWFETGKPLGWRKEDSQTTRRRIALESRKGDALKTARALLALSNVTTDKETKRKAYSDAMYLFKAHAARQKRMAKGS